jgi:peptide/nickel transport system substrate-binding protein
MPSNGVEPRAPHALYRPNRREMLRWLGLSGVVTLAGCNVQRQPGGGGTPTPTADTGTTGGEPARQVGGNYRTAVSADAESLNWLTTADTSSGAYVGLCLDGAWAIDPDQNVFPLWADVSTEDARVFTVELRDDLQWGAGYGQMTAEDWVYMIREVFQAEGNWSGYPSADDWFATNPDTGERVPIPVERTGGLTFDIKLFEADPAFPLRPVMWGQQCLPKGLLEKYVPEQDAEGLKQDEEIQTLAYSGNLGPYTYESWARESQFVTVRNPDYYMHEATDVPAAWRGAPYFERTTTKVIKEEAARLGALQAGEIDAAGVPPNKAEQFQQAPDIVVNVTPQPFVSPLVYNMRANGWEPFRRKEVRQALAYAVNKAGLAQGVYRGFAETAQTMQPQWSKWYDASRITNYGEGENYGPMARELLTEALGGTAYGYDGDALLDGNGERVSLTLWYDQGQPTEQTTAEFVAQEFGRNAGIAVALKSTSNFIEKFAHNVPPEGTTPEWNAGYFNGGPREVSVSEQAWDMSVNLGFNTYPRTPGDSATFFEEQGGVNYFGYVPEQPIVGLYERASRTLDEAERKTLLGEAFGRINEEQPFAFLVMSSSISGYRDTVRGYIEDFASGWDFQTWYFE